MSLYYVEELKRRRKCHEKNVVKKLQKKRQKKGKIKLKEIMTKNIYS